MKIDILQAIIQRRKYPLSGKTVEFEIRYVTDILNTNNSKVLLIFPTGVLARPRSQTFQLRELIFKNWRIAGIFDIKTIFEPETSIEFSLLHVQRTEPEKVCFGTFTGRAFTPHQKKLRQDEGLGELPSLSQSYQNYLTSIEHLITTENLPPSHRDFKFYEVGVTEFDDSQLNTRFYDPDLTENEEKIRREKWVHLEEVADVLVPRPTNQPARLLTPKNFEYPFPEELSISDNGTNIPLKQGDIVVSSIDINQAFLVSITPAEDVRPSHFMYIIRPRSDLVTSYYLFLYLKSDTARKYAMRYEKGSVFRKIDLQTLRSFPIVLPSLITQKQSFQLFERLFLRKSNDPLVEINKFLFTPQRLPQKAIQKEFILEVIESLQQSKRELISRLLMADFDEVEKCLDIHAYKSSLILCGSILEVVLLDWLSEVERKDYFSSSNDIKLFDVIKKLKDLLGDAYDKADNIRKKRNLVHPRELLKSSAEINDELCRTVISNLKDVLGQRGIN